MASPELGLIRALYLCQESLLVIWELWNQKLVSATAVSELIGGTERPELMGGTGKSELIVGTMALELIGDTVVSKLIGIGTYRHQISSASELIGSTVH